MFLGPNGLMAKRRTYLNKISGNTNLALQGEGDMIKGRHRVAGG
ncbi:hypothetical protein [Leptospira kobayashii]|nr:hypothetical protein [Leptospira kobayashii]